MDRSVAREDVSVNRVDLPTYKPMSTTTVIRLFTECNLSSTLSTNIMFTEGETLDVEILSAKKALPSVKPSAKRDPQ